MQPALVISSKLLENGAELQLDIRGETHTLGNILQQVTEVHSDTVCSSYQIQHPSEDRMLLNITSIDDDDNVDAPLRKFVEFVDQVIQSITEIRSQFMNGRVDIDSDHQVMVLSSDNSSSSSSSRVIDDRVLRFHLTTMTCIANALRRACMDNVHSLAISHANVEVNDSARHSDYVVSRMQLVPLVSLPLCTTLLDEVRCTSCSDGCPECSVSFTIDKTCPLDHQQPYCTVYSEDLRIADDQVYPVEGKIPLVRLAPGESFKCSGSIRNGTGKQHARYSSVCPVEYRKLSHVLVRDTSDCAAQDIEDIRSSCPRKVFGQDGLSVEHEDNCIACFQCVRVAESRGLDGRIVVRDRKHLDLNEFAMAVHSNGSLPPFHIVISACEYLLYILKQVRTHIVSNFATTPTNSNDRLRRYSPLTQMRLDEEDNSDDIQETWDD